MFERMLLRKVPALTLVLLWTWSTVPVSAQDPPAPVVPEQGLTTDDIESRLKQVENQTDLDADVKDQLTSTYQKALDNLNRLNDLENSINELELLPATVEQRVAQLKQSINDQTEYLKNQNATTRDQFSELDSKQLMKLIQEIEPGLPRSTDFGDLDVPWYDARLAQRIQEETQQKQERVEAETKRTSRNDLIRQNEQRATQFTQDRDAAKVELAPLLKLTAPTPLEIARTEELQTRIRMLDAEIEQLRASDELYKAEAASQLLELEAELASLEEKRAARARALFEVARERRRSLAAQEAIAQAQREVIAADPSMRPFAGRNQELALEFQELIAPTSEAEARSRETQTLLEKIQTQYRQTQVKVDQIGETDSIGALLRQQRYALPELDLIRERMRVRKRKLDETQFKLYEYQDELERYRRTPDDQLIDSELFPDEQIELTDEQRKAAASLVESRRGYLTQLVGQYDEYLSQLVALDQTETVLIRLVEEYTDFIDARVLWIRSSPPLHGSFADVEADLWLFSAAVWGQLVRNLAQDLSDEKLIWFGALLLLVVLWFPKLKPRSRLRKISTHVEKGSCSDFTPTLEALLFTLLLVVRFVVPGFFLAWRIRSASASDHELHAIASGLEHTCVTLFFLTCIIHICRPCGLALSHFGYAPQPVATLRRSLWLVVYFWLPVEFLERSLRAGNPDFGRDALERVAFIFGCFIWTLVLIRLLNSKRGLLCNYLANHPKSWLYQLRHVWTLFILSFPIVLGSLAFEGYYYTAGQLAEEWAFTLRFVLIVLLVRDLLLRLILMQRRRLSMEQARERRAALQEARSEDSAEPDLAAQQKLNLEQMQIDLRVQTAQTRRLVNMVGLAVCLVGAWLIWVDVLPALSVLDTWTIWTTTIATEVVPEGGGEAIVKNVPYNVTVAALAMALLVAIVTTIAARNVPGFMEMAILQKLPLDAPVRFAITSLTSYAIILIGVLVGANAISIGWSQVQYVAAALTFALGFGLQEIFANFVAGIILLFEQPIRVGDVVTVGNTTGVVTQIRIRATTITDWDRKEFIIPNREFVTGQLLNWTLTDTINRIVIEVGVAYGTDTELARDLLLKVCSEHPLILAEPPTTAIFDGFGDSALNFTVRTFLPSLENRLATVHELHTAIDREFRKHDIEIAFPQQDLHVRTIPTELAHKFESKRQEGIAN